MYIAEYNDVKLPSDVFMNEIAKKLVGMQRKTPCNISVDRYGNVGTISHINGIKSPRQKDMVEYITKGGKIYNATKVIKYDKADDTGEKAFSLIACNAPQCKNIENFCDMIATSNKVDTIVVVGALGNIEDYWSNMRTLKIKDDSDYNITCIGRGESGPDWQSYKVAFKKRSENKEKTVILYHYYDWLDCNPPTNCDNFEKFVNYIKDKNPRKIVAHCSAGVGRTGVFAACLDYLFEPSGKTPLGIVKELRKHRTFMVQTSEQFDVVCKFIARCILKNKSSKGYKGMVKRAEATGRKVPKTVGWKDCLDYDLFFGASG